MDRGSREVYGKQGTLMNLIGDQVQVFLTSSAPPCHFWPKERKSRNPTPFASWIRNAKTVPTYDSHHDYMDNLIGLL